MKVLLVDDTRTLLSLIQVYLMGWQLEFHEAKDGLEGLAKARELQPALVVTDVRMPGMDGFELCAAIRADQELHVIPVVLLTSLNDETSRSGPAPSSPSRCRWTSCARPSARCSGCRRGADSCPTVPSTSTTCIAGSTRWRPGCRRRPRPETAGAS
jgi:twitching motility two-component system response regulator PilG